MLKKLQLGLCFCLFVFSTIKLMLEISLLRHLVLVVMMNDNYEFLGGGGGDDTILVLLSKKHNNIPLMIIFCIYLAQLQCYPVYIRVLPR